jgi:hypothetical protein
VISLCKFSEHLPQVLVCFVLNFVLNIEQNLLWKFISIKTERRKGEMEHAFDIIGKSLVGFHASRWSEIFLTQDVREIEYWVIFVIENPINF